MTSISERLRAYAKINRAGGSDLEADLEEGAADEIERLRDENLRLKMGGTGDFYHAECTLPPRTVTLEDVRAFFMQKRSEGLSDRQILELLF